MYFYVYFVFFVLEVKLENNTIPLFYMLTFFLNKND